jgi:hypothetical protein
MDPPVETGLRTSLWHLSFYVVVSGRGRVVNRQFVALVQ